MFLAIAVDNLADAESLTAIEKEEEKRECENKLKSEQAQSEEELEDVHSSQEEETDDEQYLER